MKDYQAKSKLALAIRAVLWSTPLVVTALTSTSIYAAQTYSISIRQSTLDQAIKQLAIQTGTTISYDNASLSKTKSKALQGNYAVEDALSLLLQNHPFEAVKVNNGGYSIRVKAPPAPIEPKVFQLEAIKTKANNNNEFDTAGSETGTAHLATIHVNADHGENLTTEGSGLYTAKATTASNGLALSLRETPQLVSVITNQQMKDQNLTQLTDVVSQAAGLSIKQGGNIGSDNSPIYARGKEVDSYLLDGVKLMSSYASIFQSQDMALFDRVEVVRGANGLMTGAGSASASINLVRTITRL